MKWERVPLAPRSPLIYRPYEGAPKLTIEVAEVPVGYAGEVQDDHMIEEVADQDQILHAIKEPFAARLLLIDLLRRIAKALEDDDG